jgi:hypothetical protein
LGVFPAVPDAGRFMTRDGVGAALSGVSFEALADLRMYAMQFESMFPVSSAYYPVDSLHKLQRDRAATWVARLRDGVRTGTPGTGRSLLSFADVALRAGDDTLARRLIDTRLAELADGRPVAAGERSLIVERALTLATAVMLFADPAPNEEPEPMRLARTLPLARAYDAQLDALPVRGYSTRSDSTAVLYRQFDAAAALLAAEVNRPVPADALIQAEVDHVVHFLPRFGMNERLDTFLRGVQYRATAMALVDLPNGEARLAALNTRLRSLVIPRENDLDPHISPRMRVAIRDDIDRDLRARFAVIEQLRHPAPAILAHAWLHTADSVYQPTPRSHNLADGVVRVVSVEGYNADVVPILQRIHTQFATRAPGRVQSLLVTTAQGHAGPDVVGPETEVSWLARFFADKRQATFPVAVWAGTSTPAEFGMRTLAPSTISDDYGLNYLDGAAIVIDGHGLIRAYLRAQTRADEARIVARITALLAESRGDTVVPIETAAVPHP